jgi:hypothetical protein
MIGSLRKGVMNRISRNDERRRRGFAEDPGGFLVTAAVAVFGALVAGACAVLALLADPKLAPFVMFGVALAAGGLIELRERAAVLRAAARPEPREAPSAEVPSLS